MSELPDWSDANQARLVAGLAELRVRLIAHAKGEAAETEIGRAEQAEQAAIDAMPTPATLDRMTTGFGLSDFEQRLLLLSAGGEGDPGVWGGGGGGGGGPGRPGGTVWGGGGAVADGPRGAGKAGYPRRRGGRRG
jgi:hypothetical protein